MQKMSSSIFILTGPVHSGKTTWLCEQVVANKNCAGILQPVVDGRRTMYDIHSGTSMLLEANDTDEYVIKVGRYTFLRIAFDRAKNQLISAVHLEKEWLIIDEIGKLEIEQNDGLEPTVSELIQMRLNNQLSPKLLLVIRDYLLDDAIKKYGLDNASVMIFDGKNKMIL